MAICFVLAALTSHPAAQAVSPPPPLPEHAELEQLNALGYLAGSAEPPARAGVTQYDPERACPGLNLYTSGHALYAALMDLSGKVLHEWRYAASEQGPGASNGKNQPSVENWRRAHCFPNGDLLAIRSYTGILRLDKDSKLLWYRPNLAHHDLAVDAEGNIHLLAATIRSIPELGHDTPVLEDCLVTLDPEGNEIRRVSILMALARSPFEAAWKQAKARSFDLLHTNTVSLLDGTLAAACPAFKEGNILTSFCNLDRIAVLDPAKAKFTWMRQGSFQRQHDPQILPNGNLLLFDNRGAAPHSRVIEYKGCSGEAVWDYSGTAERPFFTETCGAAQRLPNGNTLICESETGRAFEVTPAGECVWEFHNPHRTGGEDQFIATLFDLTRLPPDFPADWAEDISASAPPPNDAELEQLDAIGYLAGSTEPPASTSVTQYDPDRVCPGLNLYTSGHALYAALMDLSGKVLHEWHCAASSNGHGGGNQNSERRVENWRRVHCYPNGDLLAIHEYAGIRKLDRDSKLLWYRPNLAHHDLALDAHGNIYVLAANIRSIPELGLDKPVLEDCLVVLDPQGNEKKRVSILKALARSPFQGAWEEAKTHTWDLLHTNTVSLLDGALADTCPAFQQGNILTSFRDLDLIAVLDIAHGKITWTREGGFLGQHDPQILPNGNLLLFDNRGFAPHSRVIEYKGCSGEVVWDYRGTPERPFGTYGCGAAHRLPNGNTLICESETGRAFEVTPAGECVWEFYNPHRTGNEDQFIATLFDLVRLPPDFPADWAEAPTTQRP